MKLPETFEQMGGLGRMGAVAMAAGALTMAGSLCLDFLNDIEVGEHRIIDVEEDTTVLLLGSGIATMLGGQQVLLWDKRRREKQKEPE